MVLTSLTKYREAGLLLLRIGLGSIFIYAYGWPHLAGGAAKWRELGHSMQTLHIHFAPTIWGFAAAFSESIGAALFVIGFLFRPACMLLSFTVLVAMLAMRQAHAAEMLVIFFAMIFIGPGKYSFDKS